MGRKEIQAILEKYGATTVALFSVFGLASAFAVHIAGFLILLPRGFWPVVDAYFVTGLLTRFSIFLAFSLFCARYTNYLVTSVLGPMAGLLLNVRLLASVSGRRLIRIRARGAVEDFAISLERAQAKHGYDYSKIISILGRKGLVRSYFAFAYYAGRGRGCIDYYIGKYTIILQLLTVLFALSFLYTTLLGGVILVSIGVALILAFPPSFLDRYFERPFFFWGVSPQGLFEIEFVKIVTLPKLTVLLLSLSFTLGILHHKRLISNASKMVFLGTEELNGSLVLSTTNGFVVYNQESGYSFLSNQNSAVEKIIKK